MDNHIMEIKDGVLHLYKKEKIKSASLEAVLKEMASDNWSTEVLPPNCRISGSLDNGKLRYFCIERPPMISQLLYRTRGRETTYKLSLGFVQFWIVAPDSQPRMSYNYISTTKHPIRGMDDQLYSLPWPNTYPDGRRCDGTSRASGSTHYEMVTDFMQGFFGRTCNDDLDICWPDCFGGGSDRARYKKWEELSKENPMFGVSKEATYNKLCTVREMIARLGGRSG